MRGDPGQYGNNDEGDPDVLDLKVAGHPRDRRPGHMLAIGGRTNLRIPDDNRHSRPDDVPPDLSRIRSRPASEPPWRTDAPSLESLWQAGHAARESVVGSPHRLQTLQLLM